MSGTLTELRGRLQERRDTLAKVFTEAGDTYDLMKATGLTGADMKSRVEQVQALDKELNDLFDEVKQHPETVLADTKTRLDQLSKLQPHPGHQPPAGDNGDGGAGANGAGANGNGRAAVKSLGARFAELETVKGRSGHGHVMASLDADDVLFEGGVKTTFTTGGSNLAPLSIEDLPGIQLIRQQPLKIADLLASGVTTRETIRYVVENSFTNAATVVAEGAEKPEAAWDTDIVTDNVTKIAVLSRVTDELFNDFPMLRDYIDNRMRFMVGQTEEAELYAGGGSGAHLTGITNRSGIQTHAAGGDPVPDAIYKAMVLIQTGPFLDPDGVVMHPLDWQDVALSRTDDGLYIWGNPNGDSANPRIWGLPVVVTQAATQNTALVGAFKISAQIWRREGITVDATNSNEDDFKNNLIMLRMEERLGLAVYYPSGFCKVTGV